MFFSQYRFGTLGSVLRPSVVIDCYYFCPDVGFKKHKNKLKEIGKVFLFQSIISAIIRIYSLKQINTFMSENDKDMIILLCTAMDS